MNDLRLNDPALEEILHTPDYISDEEVIGLIKDIPEHYSASYAVDLGATLQMFLSVPSPAVAADAGVAITSGGTISSLSGVLVGDVVNLNNANTFCNVWVAGKGFGSGPLILQVQCSDTNTSGSFTDPTSGLAQIPPPFSSGGQLIIGSGPATDATLGTFSSGYSGAYLLSGFLVMAGFQRTGTFARLNVASGFYDGTLMAGFASQFRTVGSGGGASQQPAGSGNFVVSV